MPSNFMLEIGIHTGYEQNSNLMKLLLVVLQIVNQLFLLKDFVWDTMYGYDNKLFRVLCFKAM